MTSWPRVYMACSTTESARTTPQAITGGPFFDSRMSFLNAVLARSERVEPYLRKRITSSTEYCNDVVRQIKPSMCEHYVALWKHDMDAWEQRLKSVPTGLSVKAALRELDLMPSGRSPYALAGILGGAPVDAIQTLGGAPVDAIRALDSRPLISGRHQTNYHNIISYSTNHGWHLAHRRQRFLCLIHYAEIPSR